MTETQTNGAAFGIVSDVDAFDLDAWIDGAKLPERSVVVFQRPDKVAEYEALEQELQAAPSDEDQAADDRLSSRSSKSVIADRMHQLRGEMQSSAVVFRFRSLAPGELDEVLAEAGKGASPDEQSFRVTARQCVAPAGITWQQMKALHKKLGDGYFASTILHTAQEASAANGVSLPFSLAASVARRTKDS